jgi:ABC-2 type transport system permease protein
MKSLFSFIQKTSVIAEFEIIKIFRDPTEIFTRSVQPALWLLVFGQVFARMRITGNVNYLDFMAPGILAQSTLFVSIFYGIAIIWERDLGLTHKFLATPTPRAALVLGKSLSAGVRCVPLAIIVYVLAVLLGVHIVWEPLALLGVLAMVILGAIFFSTFSLIIACLVKTRERFMGIGQLMTMPLFFASNAIYPIALMPGWLQVLSRVNPLTYMIDALREMMTGQMGLFGLGTDFLVLIVSSFILVMIGSALYKQVIT